MLTACRCCLKNALFENNVATVYISFACICLTFIVVCCVCAIVHRHKQMYTRCINFETDLTTDETIPYWVVCKFDRKSCLHLMYTQLALANINIPPSSSMRHWDGCFYFAYCQVPEKQYWHRNSNYLGANCIFSHHQCGMTCAARTPSPQYWDLLLVVEFYEWNWQHKKEICQLLNACHRPIYSMCNILMQWTQQNVWVWGKMSTINVLNFYDVTQLKNPVRHMSV